MIEKLRVAEYIETDIPASFIILLIKRKQRKVKEWKIKKGKEKKRNGK